jgi:pyruvyl transferase EpsO
MERFRSHGNCHIFARDNRSLEILLRGGIAQASAMPDMAQYLWGSLLPDLPPFYEAQPLRFVRRDKESKASAALQGGGGAAQTYDWPFIVSRRTNRYARLMLNAILAQCKLRLHTQKYWQWRPAQDRAIRDGVRFFSRYHAIYTNRLHAMILGLLLEREVCAYDNSYGKLSSYCDTWLSGMEGLKWEPEK